MTLSLTTRAGLGRRQTWLELDGNWIAIQAAVNALSAVSPGLGISTITQPAAGTLRITLTDSSIINFDLPIASYVYRGTWAATTVYAVNDTFQIGGSLYVVLLAHTSASTFDAGANDGSGHDYYQELLSSPANAIPDGGTTRQALTKIDGTDFNTQWVTIRELPSGGSAGKVVGWLSSGVGQWVDAPSGIPTGGASGQVLGYGGTSGTADWEDIIQVPTGGTSGQVLTKNSSTDGDCSFADPAASAIDFSAGVTGLLPKANGGTGVDNTAQSHNLVFASPDGSSGSAAWRFLTAGDLSQVDLTVAALSATTGTVNLDPSAADPKVDVYTVTPTGNLTINLTGIRKQRMTFLITTSGTTSYNVTFTGNALANGTIATGTVTSKRFTIDFVGTAGGLFEVSRVGPM
jgi:hypothetical protein